MKIIVKNRKLLVFIVLLISSAVSKGQIYKYIGLEDGLNNQKIYHIQKDRRGYMWFLTQEGVDRYDGKHIKHYTFSDDSMKLDSRIALNWLYMDQEDVLWVIGQKGRIFRYDSQHDKFELAYVHPELIRNKFQAFLDYGYLDKNDHIWLCYKDTITWYNIRTGTTQHMPKPVDGAISTIEQADGGHFFIGTGSGLFCVGIEKGELKQIPDEVVKSIVTPVHELYYHTVSKQLFVGSYKEGILIYDIGKTPKITPCYAPNNVEVNQIVALNADELLIATGGKGVYKLNVNTCKSEPYITADYSSYNGMNGNNINDIYVDEEERIWLANYPTGITVRNNRYGSYDLIRHSLGNSRSLVNDQVHDVVEDSDGDLWFATSNGISIYQTDTKEWRSFFSSFDPVPDDENHIFLALCEVSPGVIWAGGFTSGIYKIEKKKGFKISYLSPAAIAGVRPDQYIFDIKKELEDGIKEKVEKNQKEYYLREQLKYINEELDGTDGSSEIDEYMEKLESLNAADEIKEQIEKEIRRYKVLSQGSSEANVERGYIETLLSLPWENSSQDSDDIENAAKILDENHYGMKKVKERILETLAVRKVSHNADAPIICLVGPPGTGKTSIARSVAQSLNKEYVRICLGGVKDEAEIRGHRRTYVGAMPGRIIDGLRKAKVKNPLMLLDEIDKVSNDYRSDTSSALLEVLDGEQNSHFVDHYIDMPVDLSEILFIATANDLSEVSRPLLDRMEIIEVSSYTKNEKLHIAKEHLVAKQLKKNGLTKKSVRFTDKALAKIIDGYTMEAGVRELERMIAAVLRLSLIHI